MSKQIKYQKRDKPNSSFCCVPQCAVSGKFNSYVSFHHFPRDEALRKLLIHNIQGDNLVIKRSIMVCSSLSWKPTSIWAGCAGVVEWNDYTLPPARLSVWERVQCPEDDAEEEMDEYVAQVP